MGLIPGVFTKGLGGEGKAQGQCKALGPWMGEGLSSLGPEGGEKGGSGYLTWEAESCSQGEQLHKL